MKKSVLVFSIFIAYFASVQGQTCECNISEVLNNTVSPCEKTIGTVVNVSTAAEFQSAIANANSSGGIRSASGNRDAVILTGDGMVDVAPATVNGLSLVGDNITVADLTIRSVGNHAISTGSDDHFIHNVRIQDTYEQMIKGTTSSDFSNNCTVQCSLFEYTAGIGPQFYIGGLDIHGGINWTVNDNVFYDISSPSGSLAEHAIHFWDFSADNIVERNMIVNCDRGIGFGLGSSPNNGGIIRNNTIHNNGFSPFNDVGIGLETSPNTKVYNCNRSIQVRNGATANVFSNIENATADYYVSPSTGDLHLDEVETNVVDQGVDLLADVTMDIDQNPRTAGSYDIGADEYGVFSGLADMTLSNNCIEIFPNPVNDAFTINGTLSDFSVDIYDLSGTLFQSLNLSGNSHTIDTSNLPSGVYVVRVVNIANNALSAEYFIKH